MSEAATFSEGEAVLKTATAQGEWFGHPKGLYVLFFTEMWERFSYYGMRALLVLYMTKYLIDAANGGLHVVGYGVIRHSVQWFVGLFGMHDQLSVHALSLQIYGLYTGFVYFTPFFGGILADRFFGQRKSVYIGGVLMAIGHFLMAVEHLFFVALFFLILGNGCFKPNISTQVGNLYPEGDHRRDSAFTIFYMGINLGAFFSPLVCGTLGQKVGWHYGFGAAGVGMLVGLAVYHFGKHLLPPDRMMKKAAAHETAVDQKITWTEWKVVGALVFLCVVNIVFWAVYEQQGSTLQLWADANTRWQFFGHNIPTSWYQSFNPAFIFIFAPLMNMFWGWQDKRGWEPSSVTKMGIGCVLLGGAFIIMIAASKILGPGEKGSLLWLVTTTWLFTMGELYLSPIGLSLVTKVAPARMVSMLMGMWFLSSFFGNYLSGFIGGFYETMSKDAFFTLLMAMGVGAGLIFFAANKPLRRITEKKRGSEPTETHEIAEAEMSTNDATQSSGKNTTTGAVLIVISLAMGLAAYAHRPVDGFMDAMQRANSWVFNPGAYYVILFIAALIGLAGILRIANGMKAPNIANILSAGGDGSSLDKIKKAKELLDAGAINAAEFEKIKKSVLER